MDSNSGLEVEEEPQEEH